MVIPQTTGWSTLYKEPETEFQVSAFTRYEPLGDSEVPRALHRVVDLAAANLDDAVNEALGNTGGLITMMAFVGNSHVDSPELHVAYDVTGDEAEHEYVQTYRPPTSELPQLGAHLDVTLFEAVHDRLVTSEHRTRLGMALVQYNEALRSLRPAGDVTAAGHLRPRPRPDRRPRPRRRTEPWRRGGRHGPLGPAAPSSRPNRPGRRSATTGPSGPCSTSASAGRFAGFTGTAGPRGRMMPV
ncbi:hypothetical protein [Kitasatospora azatica]|uniref:hypothetical protein n=1 Tax=Kitasatospora azatica TaxID=58347 RepID=UPI000565ECC2|nr:hypothetical protein [Kitasatospora azatica]